MITAFEQAFGFTLKWEGGYVNDPADSGGETKFGISKKSYPGLDIRSLTVDEAYAIYLRDYWDKVGGDKLPHPLGLAVFDYAVNSGVRTASAALQRAIGATPDGRVGPGTKNALRLALERQWPNGPEELALRVMDDRIEKLCAIVKARPSQAKFLLGWMRRTHDASTRIRV